MDINDEYFEYEYDSNDDYNLQEEKYENDKLEETIDDDRLYCKNLCPQLAKVMGIKIKNNDDINNKYNDNNDNSNNDIIKITKFCRQYYKNSFDYIQVIKDDIRNFRKLEPPQLEYIKNMDNIQKNSILEILHECYGEAD
jgi:hypothetical protein